MRIVLFITVFLISLQTQAASQSRALDPYQLQHWISSMISQHDEGEIQLTLRFSKDRPTSRGYYPSASPWQYEVERQFNYQEKLRLRRCC